MKSKNFNGLVYDSFGEGPTVVFIHGFLESISMWNYLPLEKLDIHCILVDLPGHGKSKLNDLETSSMEFYARKLQELIDHLNIQQFSVVGHSMGGYVGLAWLQLNESIQKLTFLNSHFFEDSEEKKKDRISVSNVILQSKSLFLKTAIPNLFLRPKDHSTAITAIIQEAETFDSKGIAFASLAMGRRSDFTNYVNKNPHKFSMILGKEDSIVPIALISERLIPSIQLDVIEDCGHMAHIEKSQEVFRLLQNHLPNS